jgi:hypothetical protein
MSFSVSPVVDFPPATGTEPTLGVQFQFEGENIGGRNTDTVNFTGLPGILRVTVGVGEQVNVLTVTADEPEEPEEEEE